MNRFTRMFSWSLWAGFLLTLFLSLPGIFKPATVADLVGAKAPVETIWLAFACLLWFITSWFQAAAAMDPMHNLPTAGAVVLGHFLLAFFWLWVYRSYHSGPILPLGVIELLIAIVQVVLFVGSVRDATRLEH